MGGSMLKIGFIVLMVPVTVAPAMPQYAAPSQIVRVAEEIHRLAPHLGANRVRTHAASILRASLRYHVEPQIMVAITFQESSFRENLPEGAAGELGICQIRKAWLAESSFRSEFPKATEASLKRSETSFTYEAWILSKYKRKGDRMPYWSRYNSSNPEARSVYISLVNRHLRKLGFDLKAERSVASL